MHYAEHILLRRANRSPDERLLFSSHNEHVSADNAINGFSHLSPELLWVEKWR